ncbi:hypothetical protein DHC50_10655 [Arenibacter sp. A80]|nr:hypothetical protein [Arenibacter sp. A80]RFT56751.1 hypothetical protein D0S24_10645 [Arenibacter sp. P308M17]
MFRLNYWKLYNKNNGGIILSFYAIGFIDPTSGLAGNFKKGYDNGQRVTEQRNGLFSISY